MTEITRPAKGKTLFPFSTHNTSDTTSPHQPVLQLSKHQLGVPQFTSITNYPELVQTPGLRAQFQETSITSDAKHKSQVVTYASDQQVINWGFLQTLPQVRQLAIMAHRTQRNT